MPGAEVLLRVPRQSPEVDLGQFTAGSWIQSAGREDRLEKEMATHSSILAWKIPWTEEPGGLPSMRVAKSQTRLSD